MLPERHRPRHRVTLGRWNRALAAAGMDVARLLEAARNVRPFVSDLRTYRAATAAAAPMVPPVRGLLPMLTDRSATAGALGDYFHQDLWMARRVIAAQPSRHLDVGSRVDGFVAHLLTVRDVELVDVRELGQVVPGLSFIRDDGRLLGTIPDGSVPSLSSLHAVEHFGLGRYGDEIDPRGAERALHTFARVLGPGGRLYLSLPVGRPRTEFNAHRIVSPLAPIDTLGELELVEFAGIDDEGRLREGVRPEELATQSYAVGLYVFERP